MLTCFIGFALLILTACATDLPKDGKSYFSKPLFSEYLKEAGYGTAMSGKEDHYYLAWGPGQSLADLNKPEAYN